MLITQAKLTAGIAELKKQLQTLADTQFYNDCSDHAEHIDVQNVTDKEAHSILTSVFDAMSGW